MKKLLSIVLLGLLLSVSSKADIIGKKLLCNFGSIHYGISFVKKGLGEKGNAIIYEVNVYVKGWKVIKNKGLEIETIPLYISPDKIEIGTFGKLDRVKLTYQQRLEPITKCDLIDENLNLEKKMNNILEIYIQKQKEKNKI
jgi:hypothetical protein